MLDFGVHTGAHGAENGLVAVDRGTMDLVVTVDMVDLGITRVDATNWLLAKANPHGGGAGCQGFRSVGDTSAAQKKLAHHFPDTLAPETQAGQARRAAGKVQAGARAGQGRTAARKGQASGVARGNAGDVDLCPAHCSNMHLVMGSERRGRGRGGRI